MNVDFLQFFLDDLKVIASFQLTIFGSKRLREHFFEENHNKQVRNLSVQKYTSFVIFSISGNHFQTRLIFIENYVQVISEN